MDDFLREVSECLTNQDRQRKEKELRSRIQHGDVQWFLDLSRNIYNSTNPSRAVAFQMCCNVFRDLYQPLDGVLRKEVETVALFRFRASVLQCLHMSFRDTVMPTSRYGHTTIWNTPEGESQWLSSMFRRRRSTAVDARMMADSCADWSCKTQRCGRCGRLLSKGSGDWCAVSMVRVEGLPDATSMVCEPCLQEWRRSATFLCAFFGAASIHALEVNRLRVVGPLWKDAVVLLQHEYRRGARRFFTSTISTFPPYVYQVLVGSRSMMTTREEPRRVVHREMILLRARCMVQLAVESTHAFCSSLTIYEEFLGDLQGCAAADEPPNDDHELCTPGCRHMKTFYFLVKLMEYLSQVLQRLGDHVTTLTTLRHLRAEYLRLVPRQPLHERLMVALLILHILRGRLSNEVETVWWSMLRAVTQESVAVGFLVVALTPANDAEPQSWPELESIRVSLPIYARICRGVFTQADGSAVLLHPFRDEVVHVQLCGDEVPNKGPKALPATREVQFEVTSATGPTKRISFVFKNKSVRNDLVACALWKFVDELCCPAECRDDSPAYGVLHLGEEMGMMEKAPGVDMKNLTSYDQLLRSPEHRQNYQVSFTESILLNHVLGVCDRHTENIRLSPKGWIYHIDYEYLLDRKKPTSETVTMASTVRIDIDAIARIAKFCNRSTEETRRTIYGQVYQWITLLEPHVALFVDLLCCTPDYVDERLQVEESIQRRFFWSLSNHLAKMELVTTLMQSEGRHRLRDRVRAVGQAVNQQSSNLMSSALSLFRWPSSLSSS